MTLLIDSGNTRIKLDWLSANAAQRTQNTFAFVPEEADAARQWLASLPVSPRRAVGVNVAGESVRALIESLLPCPVNWIVGCTRALGVNNIYEKPEQLGADRWAAMLGLAWHERKLTSDAAGARCAVLAMFGTATTIDTLQPRSSAPLKPDDRLDTSGTGFDFIGGLILPGPAMMARSLSAGTARLPEAQGDTTLYPQNTTQAIVTGIAAAQAGALLRQWRAGLAFNGAAPRVYVSGGAWPLVRDEVVRLLAQVCSDHAQEPAGQIRWLDAPVLDGLAYLAGQERTRVCQ